MKSLGSVEFDVEGQTDLADDTANVPALARLDDRDRVARRHARDNLAGHKLAEVQIN